MATLQREDERNQDSIVVHIRIPRKVRLAMQEAARLANMRTVDWVRLVLEKATKPDPRRRP